MKIVSAVAAAIALLCLCVAAHANVLDLGPGLSSLQTVLVGNPGNAADTHLTPGGTSGYGSVGYTYNIGKYEVTTAQYVDFLNHKARSDSFGLWNAGMADTTAPSRGCNIQRSGSEGNYSYSVGSGSASDILSWGNRPVNYVSFWDSCRFSNWLNNGQGDADTESGAYTLTAGGIATNSVTRNSGWAWAVANEAEWYKAAYYDPYKAGGADYWRYSTRSDTLPSHVGADGYADPGNHANYTGFVQPGYYVYTLGAPYFRTNVGEFENSASAYGTFDQGGNVQEWNEQIIEYGNRGVRGGSFGDTSFNLQIQGRVTGFYTTAGSESAYNGFRLVQAVPEPSSLIALAGGLLAFVGIRRRRA